MKYPRLLERMNFNVIVLKRIEIADEQMFAEECINQSDFQLYIEDNKKNLPQFLIVKKGDKNIGIFAPNIKKNMGIKNAIPILYMTYKKSIYTLMTLNVIMCHLFQKEEVDRIEIRVYSLNSQMLQLMNKTPFKYEGYLKYRGMHKMNPIGIYYYSLLKEEFDELIG